MDLVPGSWAQRSDVLCVGDVVVSVNGIDASVMTQSSLIQALDESDRCADKQSLYLEDFKLLHKGWFTLCCKSAANCDRQLHCK